MKTNIIFFASLLTIMIHANAQSDPVTGLPDRYWQVGIGLGELPFGGSFKPSLTFGYHISEQLYFGLVYQFRDHISRDGSSFNAQSAGLDGLTSSRESVARRFMLQVRYTPFRYGPYLSGGFVYNGADTETMSYDSRDRTIAGEIFNGNIGIVQTRPGGGGLAFGLGYQYNFKNGISAGVEWTPVWTKMAIPEYSFSGSAELSVSAEQEIIERMDKGFRGSVTNRYKIFHIGISYRFKYNTGTNQ